MREFPRFVRLSPEGKLSDYFNVGLGLKQVEPLSPILFLLFVNDISDSIDFNNLTENYNFYCYLQMIWLYLQWTNIVYKHN